MAHVHNQPRCRRCREFRPTVPVRTGFGIVQMCSACQLEAGWLGAHMPKLETTTCDLCRGSGNDELSGKPCIQCGGRTTVTRAVK